MLAPRTFRDLADVPAPACPGSVWDPPADVFVLDDAVLVRFELAGTAPSDVVVRASATEVVIAGARHEPAGPRPRRVDRMEIAFGHFRRVVPLPAAVAADRARARMADGLLEILLPLADPGHLVEVVLCELAVVAR